jgi:hypothetical protein
MPRLAGLSGGRIAAENHLGQRIENRGHNPRGKNVAAAAAFWRTSSRRELAMRNYLRFRGNDREWAMKFERNLLHGTTIRDRHVPRSPGNLNANENDVKRHETPYFDRGGIFPVHGRENVGLRGE